MYAEPRANFDMAARLTAEMEYMGLKRIPLKHGDVVCFVLTMIKTRNLPESASEWRLADLGGGHLHPPPPETPLRYDHMTFHDVEI